MKHYTFNEAREMTGEELLDDLGITRPGQTASFAVNGSDTWKVHMTIARGKLHGQRFIHVKTSTMIPVMDDGEKVGEIFDNVHFRGRVTKRIGSLKRV